MNEWNRTSIDVRTLDWRFKWNISRDNTMAKGWSARVRRLCAMHTINSFAMHQSIDWKWVSCRLLWNCGILIRNFLYCTLVFAAIVQDVRVIRILASLLNNKNDDKIIAPHLYHHIGMPFNSLRWLFDCNFYLQFFTPFIRNSAVQSVCIFCAIGVIALVFICE